jgi:uncharacterized phage infection (PIP) family protein YhgE
LAGQPAPSAKAQAAIEAQREAIEADLQNVAKEADKIGNAVKSLVTGVLTTISSSKGSDSGSGNGKATGDGKSTEDTGRKSNPKAEAVSTAAADSVGADGDGNVFPVEAIGAASDAVSGSVGAVDKFRKDNARLAALYQQMASLNAELTIVQVVGDQAEALANSLQEMAGAAGNVQRTWASVVSGFRQFNDEVENMGGGETQSTTLLATLNVGISRGWSRLGQSLDDIKQAFLGGGTAILQPGGSIAD